jgi:VanZ family protein
MVNGLKFFPLWRALGYGLILLVIYLSLTPAPPNIPIENSDKMGHVAAYAVLMVWFASLYADVNIQWKWICAASFVALGIGLEFAQVLTDHRTFELADMAADIVGVTLGWITALLPFPNLLLRLEQGLSKIDAFLWDSRRSRVLPKGRRM